MATETTLGQLLLAKALPDAPEGEVMTKKVLHRHLARAARQDPRAYARLVDEVKQVGDFVATTHGLSVGLDDIEPDYARRDAILKPALQKVKRAKTDDERRTIIEAAQKEALKLAPEHPSDMALMARSGGRGNAAQLMRTVVSPVAASDREGVTIPWLIERSYAEGLRPHEAWVAGEQARRDAIQSKESVSEPGAFGKVMTANMSDKVITNIDCGTPNGTWMDVDDPQAQDRVLARAAGGAAAGEVFTGELARKLKAADVERVMLRGVLTCEQPVCSRCYGLNEWGKFHDVGVNVGVRSAQALSEPLTQFALNAKHGVRTIGQDRGALVGLTGLQNFLDFPQSFAGKAVLAQTSGKVTRVDKAPQGGAFVYVDAVKHYVPPQVAVRVQVGDELDAGDSLSSGVGMPNEVVALKDLGTGRQHVANTVHQIYAGEGSVLDKRHAELLSLSHLGWMRVEDDPDGEYVPGEVVPAGALAARWRGQSQKLDLSGSPESWQGKVLARPAAEYTAGTRLTPAIVASLKRRQVSTVDVYTGRLSAQPVVATLTRAPLMDPNWMRRLGHRYLRDSLVHGATHGDSADIHGHDPVSAYAIGAEIRRGPGGRY